MADVMEAERLRTRRAADRRDRTACDVQRAGHVLHDIREELGFLSQP